MEDDEITYAVTDPINKEGECDPPHEPNGTAPILPTLTQKSEAVLDRLVVVFGVTVRCTFFLVGFVAIYIYVASGDYSGLSTELAHLTIKSLFEAVLRPVSGAYVAYYFWKWAFISGKKNYRAWALAPFQVAGAGWLFWYFFAGGPASKRPWFW